jgi:hypothetical protein
MLSCREKEILINDAYSAAKSFQLKLKLFKRQVSVNNWGHFPTVSGLQSQIPQITFRSESFAEVIENLEEFTNRFVDRAICWLSRNLCLKKNIHC